MTAFGGGTKLNSNASGGGTAKAVTHFAQKAKWTGY